jgi:ureidoacrylate peracid hydrolase
MATLPSSTLSDRYVIGTPDRDCYKVDERSVDMTRPSAPIRSVTVSAVPQTITFDLNKAALIIIDMQNDFLSEHGWLSSVGHDVKGAWKLYRPIGRTAQGLRKVHIPIIWVNWGVREDRLNLSPGTQHTFNPLGPGPGLGGMFQPTGKPSLRAYPVLAKGSWGAAVVDELTPSEGDIHVDKHRISGFWDTPLDSILRNLGVRTLLFAGVNADQCVYATLMDANFHGYDTVLLEDCTATTSPACCMEATLFNIRFAFGFTAVSKDLLSGIDQYVQGQLNDEHG